MCVNTYQRSALLQPRRRCQAGSGQQRTSCRHAHLPPSPRSSRRRSSALYGDGERPAPPPPARSTARAGAQAGEERGRHACEAAGSSSRQRQRDSAGSGRATVPAGYLRLPSNACGSARGNSRCRSAPMPRPCSRAPARLGARCPKATAGAWQGHPLSAFHPQPWAVRTTGKCGVQQAGASAGAGKAAACASCCLLAACCACAVRLPSRCASAEQDKQA